MLFRKKIQRSCNYCSNGTRLNDGSVLCMRRGIVSQDDSCRKCKRVPVKQKAPDFSKYDGEDFSL